MSTTALNFAIILGLTDLASDKLKAVAGSIGKLGAMTAAAGVALGPASRAARGFFENVARQAIALDDVAAKLRSMPGIQDEAVDRIVRAGRRWATQHTESAEQFVDTSYMMLSAGLNAQQALAATETGLRVAKATMGDAGQTANLLATAFNNFGNKSGDVNREIAGLGDTLAKTQQLFQFANMQQLADGLNYATPAALAARMEFVQMNAVIGQLNNSGLQGSMAGTAFSASLRQMTKASKDLGFVVAKNAQGGTDFVGTLENIQAKFGDLTKLSDKQKLAFQSAFGDEALRAVILLSGRLDELKNNQRAVADAAGAAERAQGKMESAAGARMQIAMNNWNEFRLVMGERLLPVLKDLIPKFSRLVERVSAFAQANPRVANWTLIAVVVGAVAAPLLNTAAALMLFIGAAAKLAPVLALVAPKLGFLARAGSGLMLVLKVLTYAVTFFGYALRALVLSNPLLALVTGLVMVAALVITHWDKVKTWFTTFFSWVGNKLKGVMPDWVLRLVGIAPDAAPPRPKAAPAHAAGQQRVGGTVKVEIDSTGRPRVADVRSHNPAVPIDVDVGRTMVAP